MSTYSRNASRRTWRLIWIMALMALLAMATVRVTLSSVARAAAAKQPQTSSSKPASGSDLPGEIQDDPTTAPDLAESADNNVSFPADI